MPSRAPGVVPPGWSWGRKGLSGRGKRLAHPVQEGIDRSAHQGAYRDVDSAGIRFVRYIINRRIDSQVSYLFAPTGQAPAKRLQGPARPLRAGTTVPPNDRLQFARGRSEPVVAIVEPAAQL